MYCVLCGYFRMVTYPDQGVTAALKITQWENHCWCYRSAEQRKADHSTDQLSQKRPHQFKWIFKYKPKSYNYKFTSSAPFGMYWGSWWPSGIRGNWAVFVHGTYQPLWKQESIKSCRMGIHYGSEHSMGWTHLLRNYPVLSSAGAGADEKVTSIMAGLQPRLWGWWGGAGQAEQKGHLWGCLWAVAEKLHLRLWDRGVSQALLPWSLSRLACVFSQDGAIWLKVKNNSCNPHKK